MSFDITVELTLNLDNAEQVKRVQELYFRQELAQEIRNALFYPRTYAGVENFPHQHSSSGEDFILKPVESEKASEIPVEKANPVALPNKPRVKGVLGRNLKTR